MASQNGREIPIEERAPEEVGTLGGSRVIPEGTKVWNPAFDVTPAHLVTAFITDGGILRPPFPAAIKALFSQESREEGAEPQPWKDGHEL